MKNLLLLGALLCALSPLAFAANDTSSNENPGAAPEITQTQQAASATGATITLQDEIKKTAVSETARAAVFNSTLDEVVVTTTRIEQPLKQTLSSTTVITQEDIKNSQAADVPTILRSVPGVEISQTGGIGKSSSVFLRGSNSAQTLVLLDGVRINSATSGTTAIEHLMLDQIERIEIVRGNVSSLYGSEAIGGVIQIFTKRGRGNPVFNVSAGAGTHGTQRAAAGFGGKIENTDFNLQVSRFITEGVSAINPASLPPSSYANANPDNDGYQNTSVSANIRQAFNTDHSLSVGVFNSLGHNQYDSPNGPSTSSNTNENRLSKLSLTSDNRLSEPWQSKILVAKGTDSYQIFTNGATSPGYLYQTDNLQLNWVNQITFSEGKQLLLGVEHLGQKVTSDLNPGYDQTERKVNSLFIGYTGNYGSHQLQTNLRLDSNTQFGIANTGLLGYGYALTDAWRATTSYSTAFRAPTFNDLYWPGYSDPNLKPERSNNSEAGLHYAEAERKVDIVYFDNQIKDFITLDSNYFPVNIDQVRITGVELSYSEKFGDTGVKLSATNQNPHNLTTDTTLDRRAKLHSNLLITKKSGSLLLGAEWQYSDSRQDKTNTLDAYNVFNLTAAYTLSKQLKLSIRADNITDQNNSNAYSYNPLGRTFFASLSYQQ